MSDWYGRAREADGRTDEEVMAEIHLRRDVAADQLGLFDKAEDPREVGREIARKALDAAKGEIAKEEAVSRVEANASRALLDAAYDALLSAVIARRGLGFLTVTTDDVWAVLAKRGVPGPHEPRAMGPVMRKGVSAGMVKATSTFTPSMLPQNHRRPVRVYVVVDL